VVGHPAFSEALAMLVVRVELWPGGYELGKKEIATMKLANVSNLADVSDYAAVLEEKGEERLGIIPSRHFINVSGHGRRASVWSLIHRVLKEGNF
jgi:hypothetical protein